MALIKCKECETAVSQFAECCPHCGYPIKDAIVTPAADSMEVVVTDFDMSFGNMVGFLVKAAIAAIPAIIILTLIALALAAFLAGALMHKGL